jgi:hypothetical protein
VRNLGKGSRSKTQGAEKDNETDEHGLRVAEAPNTLHRLTMGIRFQKKRTETNKGGPQRS